tara:strand:- start:230 stop:466 length:237 start_codon:yes stop_codon:yes gene_type:complete
MENGLIDPVKQYGRLGPVCWTDQGSLNQGISGLVPQLADRTILVRPVTHMREARGGSYTDQRDRQNDDGSMPSLSTPL